MNVIALFLAAVVSAPAEFDTDVLPVLTRAGCNAGACHGAAASRGGFKLSLFGGDPAADHRAIVHEFEGRRVNLARPGRSLLLLKPTWELDHEGGQRFESDSEFARLLTEWIAAGAPRGKGTTLASLSIDPPQVVVPSVPTEVELTIGAMFADGTKRRVEKLALVTPADSASVEVIGDGRIRVLRPGRHALVIRFLTQVVAIQVTAPHSLPPLDEGKLAANNWIDKEVNRVLVALRLPPSPRADDATLLRRGTLDLTGRLPTAERIREYLADESEGKFAAEVDRLLASSAYAEYWTFKYARWLRIRTSPNDVEGTKTYHAWLRQQIESGRPVSEWMAKLVTSDGDSHQHGPANFHRSAADARGEAEHLTETLLGIRLRCANCHNHPLDRWTQDDYHGLAAIFARLDRGRQVQLKSTGEVNHPVTGNAAIPRLPGEQYLPATGDNRPALAAWLTSRDHRRLATAQVNRLWHSLFGRGLIEPIDDLRDTNPATHPELLDRLTQDFIGHQYDLRHTLRLLANSAAYQRSGKAEPAAKNDDRFLSHARQRPLAPEVLLDAVCDALGTPLAPEHLKAISPEEVAPGSRAITLPLTQVTASLLGPLAGCSSREECAKGNIQPASLDELAVQLHWINGRFLNSSISDQWHELIKLAHGPATAEELIEQYYLRTLSRLPTAAERKFWKAEIGQLPRTEKCQDFAWALLSCPEFVTNH